MSASGRNETTDDLLAALLDGMDAALCAFDSDGVITHWNREAERILGWSAAEAVGGAGSRAGRCAPPTRTTWRTGSCPPRTRRDGR